MRAKLLFLITASVLGLPGQELLDRIAVTVGNHVITEGEVYDQIRLTAFLNGEKLDFSADEKRKAAERLVEQYLIKQEMLTNKYPEPEASDADKMLAELVKKRFGGDNGSYRAALEKYGVTPQELKANLLWQLTALRFTDLRFQPNIQQANEPLREHLEKHTEERAAAKAAAPAKPDRGDPKTDNPEDYEKKVDRRQNALPKSVDQQLAKWLDDARKRARIEYREDAFK